MSARASTVGRRKAPASAVEKGKAPASTSTRKRKPVTDSGGNSKRPRVSSPVPTKGVLSDTSDELEHIDRGDVPSY